MNDWTTSHDRVLAQRQAEGWMFLIDTARDLWTAAGFPLPGQALACALTSPTQVQPARPLTVLYTRATVGNVARMLVARLPSGSRLDVEAADPETRRQLRGLMSARPDLASDLEQINVHRTGGWPHTRRRYDVIVSGLPLKDLTPLQVERTMARYIGLLHPGGTLTYASRSGMRMLQTLFAPRARGQRTVVGKIMATYQSSYSSGRRIVWSRLPPHRVWYLRRPLEASGERASQDGAMP